MDNWELGNSHVSPVYDPYDLWATAVGVEIRQKYYSGDMVGKFGAVGLSVFDWLLPNICRKVINSQPRVYPIVLGLETLRLKCRGELDEVTSTELITLIASLATDPTGKSEWSWGLGFPWMSKNGLYPPTIPFVTHTPYIMEALIALAKKPKVGNSSMEMFHGTWPFLESLKVMHLNSDELALSYAPVEEPRIVINANSYAALAYALHAVHGRTELGDEAKEKTIRLVRWVVRQQQQDGSWFYYADQGAGNFIDCFHSCFVVKNLLKVAHLLPEISQIVDNTIASGWRFIQTEFYDRKAGLCRRFAKRDIRDPFRWDLYDQAEYLGLLLDFGTKEEALQFSRIVEERFSRRKQWYCRIDKFGHRWGRDFLRWGIIPFYYYQERLQYK